MFSRLAKEPTLYLVHALQKCGGYLTRIAYALIWILPSVLVVNCSDKDVVEFVNAKVTIYYDDQGRWVDGDEIVVEGAEFQHLLAFFPEVGMGKKGVAPSGWEAKVVIVLIRSDGTEQRVSSNFELWSEGNGDWPSAKEFRAYIEGLVVEKR